MPSNAPEASSSTPVAANDKAPASVEPVPQESAVQVELAVAPLLTQSSLGIDIMAELHGKYEDDPLFRSVLVF